MFICPEPENVFAANDTDYSPTCILRHTDAIHSGFSVQNKNLTQRMKCSRVWVWIQQSTYVQWHHPVPPSTTWPRRHHESITAANHNMPIYATYSFTAIMCVSCCIWVCIWVVRLKIAIAQCDCVCLCVCRICLVWSVCVYYMCAASMRVYFPRCMFVRCVRALV